MVDGAFASHCFVGLCSVFIGQTRHEDKFDAPVWRRIVFPKERIIDLTTVDIPIVEAE